MNRSAAITVCVMLALSGFSFAKANPDRMQVGRAIHVSAGEKVGDLTCFGCSIYVRGQANSDATAFGGRIVLEEGGSISGDATAFGGDIRVQAGSSVLGDATAFGGHILCDPPGRIAGDVTSFGGFTGFLIVIVLPLLFVAGIVALIVFLIRRNSGVAAPAYSGTASTRV